MKWQPIETAPRDGRAILAFWSPRKGREVTAEYYGITRFENGLWWNVDDVHSDEDFAPPSHWMPLPAPPERQEVK